MIPKLKQNQNVSLAQCLNQKDVLFGRTLVILEHYLNDDESLLNEHDYTGYMDFVGFYEIKNDQALKLTYSPQKAITDKEIKFKEAIENSRYNPLLFSSVDCWEKRVAKSSKALLEYFILDDSFTGTVHFVLDELPEQGVINKTSNFWTGHELRHLHRLSLKYPKQVQQKVVCWIDRQQTQLPAYTNPTAWDLYKPSLNRLSSGKIVTPIVGGCPDVKEQKVW